jgi:hypothetical protein
VPPRSTRIVERRKRKLAWLPDTHIRKNINLVVISADLLGSFEMKLPGSEHAVVEIVKLRDYCLNPLHPRGRHKARLFASTLGLTQADASILREELLGAARDGEATQGEADEHGERYIVDFALTRSDRRAMVRSAWIVRRGDLSSTADELLYPIGLRCAMPEIELLSVVALLNDAPGKGLVRGQVGTVVESLAPGVYEVEFNDAAGRTYASLALRSDQLMRLHHEPNHQAA